MTGAGNVEHYKNIVSTARIPTEMRTTYLQPKSQVLQRCQSVLRRDVTSALNLRGHPNLASPHSESRCQFTSLFHAENVTKNVENRCEAWLFTAFGSACLQVAGVTASRNINLTLLTPYPMQKEICGRCTSVRYTKYKPDSRSTP
jgi:hypothetical protein